MTVNACETANMSCLQYLSLYHEFITYIINAIQSATVKYLFKNRRNYYWQSQVSKQCLVSHCHYLECVLMSK